MLQKKETYYVNVDGKKSTFRIENNPSRMGGHNSRDIIIWMGFSLIGIIDNLDDAKDAVTTSLKNEGYKNIEFFQN